MWRWGSRQLTPAQIADRALLGTFAEQVAAAGGPMPPSVRDRVDDRAGHPDESLGGVLG